MDGGAHGVRPLVWFVVSSVYTSWFCAQLLRPGRADRGDNDAGHGEKLDGGQGLAEEEEATERGEGGNRGGIRQMKDAASEEGQRKRRQGGDRTCRGPRSVAAVDSQVGQSQQIAAASIRPTPIEIRVRFLLSDILICGRIHFVND